MRCQAGESCSALTSDGSALTSSKLCSVCVNDLQRKLDRLPHFVTALRAFISSVQGGILASKVSSSPDPPSLINLHVDSLIGEIEDVIDRTDHLRVADLFRQPDMNFILWYRGSRVERELSGVVRALDIGWVYDKANKILGFDPIWQERHAPCPECGKVLLGNVVGEDLITCRGCAAAMSIEQYEVYCEDLIEEVTKRRRK